MPRTRPSHDDCNYCNPNEDGNDNGGDNSDNSIRLLETDPLQLESTYVRLNLKQHPLNTRYLAAIAITFTRLLSRGQNVHRPTVSFPRITFF